MQRQVLNAAHLTFNMFCKSINQYQSINQVYLSNLHLSSILPFLFYKKRSSKGVGWSKRLINAYPKIHQSKEIRQYISSIYSRLHFTHFFFSSVCYFSNSHVPFANFYWHTVIHCFVVNVCLCNFTFMNLFFLVNEIKWMPVACHTTANCFCRSWTWIIQSKSKNHQTKFKTWRFNINCICKNVEW